MVTVHQLTNASESGITNNTLSGSINLNTLTSQYTASYINNDTGGVYKYVVTGTFAVPGPVLDNGVGCRRVYRLAAS